VLFKTVCSDLSDLADVFYDIIVFFSPSSVQSLYKNFPDFQQNNTRLAAFGPTAHKALLGRELILDIPAPTPKAPSMTMALDEYIKLANK
jgi:uroporphyrinogen-III synthase